MKGRAAIIAALISAAAVGLWLRSCSGPQPRVVSAELRGESVVVTVENVGGGEGQVKVSVRLEPRGGGPPLLAEQQFDLRGRETARVTLPMRGAHGTDRVHADVEYPPR
jgi:hypothetical protein